MKPEVLTISTEKFSFKKMSGNKNKKYFVLTMKCVMFRDILMF